MGDPMSGEGSIEPSRRWSISLETEVALLKQRADSRDKALTDLMASIKEHMEKEDERWGEITDRLSKLERLNFQQKTFIGAVVIVLSAVWGAVVIALKYFGGINIS